MLTGRNSFVMLLHSMDFVYLRACERRVSRGSSGQRLVLAVCTYTTCVVAARWEAMVPPGATPESLYGRGSDTGCPTTLCRLVATPPEAVWMPIWFRTASDLRFLVDCGDVTASE